MISWWRSVSVSCDILVDNSWLCLGIRHPTARYSIHPCLSRRGENKPYSSLLKSVFALDQLRTVLPCLAIHRVAGGVRRVHGMGVV
jgi:hypothetical protein